MIFDQHYRQSFIRGLADDAVGGMGNNRGSVDSVGNNGSSVDGVDKGSSVDGVGNHRGSGNVSTSGGRGVDGFTGVLNGGNVAGQDVGGVRSSHGTSSVVGLGLLEVGLGVVVGHGVGVGVGGGLSEVGGNNSVHHRGSSVLGGGRGGGHKGKGDEGLHVECVVCLVRLSPLPPPSTLLPLWCTLLLPPTSLSPPPTPTPTPWPTTTPRPTSSRPSPTTELVP